MNELTFRFVQGDAQKFYHYFVEELKKQEICNFCFKKEILENLYFTPNFNELEVSFFIKEVTEKTLQSSFDILESSIKRLSEFILFIEYAGLSCCITENNNLIESINKSFSECIIYNPDTKKYFPFQIKDSKRKIDTSNVFGMWKDKFKDTESSEEIQSKLRKNNHL